MKTSVKFVFSENKNQQTIQAAQKLRQNYQNHKKKYLHPKDIEQKRLRLHSDYQPRIKINTQKLQDQLDEKDESKEERKEVFKKKLNPQNFTMKRSFSYEHMYKTNKIYGHYSLQKSNKLIDLRGRFFKIGSTGNIKIKNSRIQTYEVKENLRECCLKNNKIYSGQGYLKLRINKRQ